MADDVVYRIEETPRTSTWIDDMVASYFAPEPSVFDTPVVDLESDFTAPSIQSTLTGPLDSILDYIDMAGEIKEATLGLEQMDWDRISNALAGAALTGIPMAGIKVGKGKIDDILKSQKRLVPEVRPKPKVSIKSSEDASIIDWSEEVLKLIEKIKDK